MDTSPALWLIEETIKVDYEQTLWFLGWLAFLGAGLIAWKWWLDKRSRTKQ